VTFGSIPTSKCGYGFYFSMSVLEQGCEQKGAESGQKVLMDDGRSTVFKGCRDWSTVDVLQRQNCD